MRRFVLAAFALTVLAACQPATTELTEEQTTAIASDIRQAFAEQIAAVGSADLDAWMDFYVSEDATGFVGQPALWVNRLDIYPTVVELREMWEPEMAARSGHDFVTESEHVAVLGENVGLHVYKGTFTITDTLGNTSEPAPWTVSTVWARGDAGWKILHLHQSWNPEN